MISLRAKLYSQINNALVPLASVTYAIVTSMVCKCCQLLIKVKWSEVTQQDMILWR